ncbi:replication endonuclease [Pseudomonas fluorescens]|uniref:replication endonuclease n=1 Tax=Pseudomonas fluorescens TaxID=294 RepID=UPI0009BB1B60|nr:replication endonuclease [Pseudomonas fluorescens]
MKSNHNLIIPFLNKKQTISKENISEINSDISLYLKSEINVYELKRKIEIAISQFSSTTKTFSLLFNYTPHTTLPFLSDSEGYSSGNYKDVWDGKPPVSIDILQAKKKVEFDYRERIDNYDKETIAFANIINKLFGYLSANDYLKGLILQASTIPALKKELECIAIYKNIKFSDLRCAGTIYDKLDEYFVTNEALGFASDMTFIDKEFDKKDKRTFRRLRNIIRRIARKQREIHLMKNRKIGENGQVYCSEELLKYQHEKDIEQQEYVENTEVIFKDEKTGEEHSIPLSQFALTDERKASEIYMKVKDLEKIAESKGYVALFTTFTCPAEFHSNPSNGRNCWNGSTPRDASDWLSKRLVALNKDRERHEIETLGMWCKEAHKDQCVHMHSMFFVRPDQTDDLISLIHKHYSHSENAVRIVRISKEEAQKIGKKAASPASYITKYVIKSLRDKSDEAMKNKAVARLWNYHMYGFFGKTKSVLWRTFDRFFNKDPHEIKLALKNNIFVTLAKLRKENKFWEFCEYANEFIKSIIVEIDAETPSGFEYIKKIKWGYRVKDTDDCLQTKFNCRLKTSGAGF